MANTLNLDRSQRLDVVCKRGDTFKMNLELKDDDGTAIELNPTNPEETTPYYAFKMEVRAADTDDVVGSGTGGYLIQKFATIEGRTGSSAPIVSDSTNLATFTIAHGVMEVLESGVYVYDIEKRLYNSAPDPMTPNFADALHNKTPDDVETILYGVFTVNEDITL